tara:strand:- start:963 stop:1334 length:372 start_codon:yes stop_codon:yes gene_type:complete
MIIRILPKGSLALTPDGKQFATNEGKEHTLSKIRSRIKFFLGEWFADTRLGVPYYRDILGQKTPTPVIRSIFWQVLSECPGVASVVKLDVSFDARKRELTVGPWEVILQDGSFLSSKPFIVET